MGYSSWDCKELDTTEQLTLSLPYVGFSGGSDSKESACSVRDLGLIPGLGRSLEKGTATHSSILAWEIPWTEDPGGLQSIGSRKSQT